MVVVVEIVLQVQVVLVKVVLLQVVVLVVLVVVQRPPLPAICHTSSDISQDPLF